MSYTFSPNIPYGSDNLQYVNLYIQNSLPRGIIMRVHGGSWRSGISSVSKTQEDLSMSRLAQRGWTVMDINYRGWNSDDGSNANGQYPGSVDDIKTVLNYSFVSGAGLAWSAGWELIYAYIQTHGLPLVTGESAGGHLALQAVAEYGTATGLWPRAVITRSAPFDLDYNTIFIDQNIQDTIIDQYVTATVQLTQASPYSQYGTSATPGPWFSAINTSSCRFYFVHNINDTLVTKNDMAGPTIDNFLLYNPSKTYASYETVGPPLGAWPMTVSVNNVPPINTPDGTKSTLPSSGQTLGDCYLVTFGPDPGVWVYNSGTFAGDELNPASYNGFTTWFVHNFIQREEDFLDQYATLAEVPLPTQPFVTLTDSDIISANDYNTIRFEIHKILNSSIYGYGANLLASTEATRNITASAQHWSALYNDINRSIKHQTGADIPGISIPVQGNPILASFVNALESYAQQAVENSSTVHVSQLAKSTSNTNLASAPWNSTLQNVRNYQWTGTGIHYFFNLGGELVHTLGYSGTAVTEEDLIVKDFIDQTVSPALSNLTESFTITNWRSLSTSSVRTYSTTTNYGTGTAVLTATIIYNKSSNGIQAITEIIPDSSFTATINILPISISTLTYSIDAIPSPLPSIIGTTKVLDISMNSSVFQFRAGTRSSPQTVIFTNLGQQTLTVTNITLSSNGVEGYIVSTATDLSTDIPVVWPLPNEFSIAAGGSYLATLYYVEPLRSLTEIGTFYNTVNVTSTDDLGEYVLNTTQIVQAPEYSFVLNLVDYSQQYEYEDWANEYSLTAPEQILGENIANRYFLPNSDFGFVDGIQRYGLYRKPTADELKFWVDYTNNYLLGDYTLLDNIFFSSVDSAMLTTNRSLTSNKNFDGGFGYGDFYDKTLVSLDITSGSPKSYSYIIDEQFGSRISYTSQLSNQNYQGSTSTESALAFSVVNEFLGPRITFNSAVVNNTGTYSTDLTVTVQAVDILGVNVVSTQTVNLSLEVLALTDGNLVKWVSGYEHDNAVMGISYDKINGELFLTVGFGSGADSALELAEVNYLDSFVDINALGVNGDSQWGTFDRGYGLPMYKVDNYTGDGWGTFLQTYGVWPYNPAFTSTGSYPQNANLFYNYKFTAPFSGNYQVEFSVDDYGYISIDDIVIIDRTFNSGANRLTSHIATVYLEEGSHKITLNFRNFYQRQAGNPGAVGATIRNPSNDVIWTTLSLVRPIPPYLYWKEVYRIPIENSVIKTYYSNDYLVKNTFPVDAYPLGYYDYRNYFGTVSTASEKSIFTVSSDGQGNLSLTINPISTTSGIETIDKTISSFQNLPYYYSLFSSRKKNVAGTSESINTQKLVGINIQGPITISVTTPGYALPEESLTVTSTGVSAIDFGPSMVAGRQFNVYGSSYVTLGSWAPISRYWIANETGNAAFSWSRALAFKNTNSMITNQEFESWGFDPADVISARDIILYRVQTTCLYTQSWGYAIMDAGKTDITEARNITEVYRVENIPAFSRTSFDQFPNVLLPDPGPNELLYIWINDLQAGQPRGSHDNTITVKFKRTIA